MNNNKKSNDGWWKEVLKAGSIAGAFTLISILITGYQYGLSNNAFHIPYVLRLAEQAEFRHDVLYQSLANYTSVVWPLLRLMSTEQNIQAVFFAAFVVARFLTFCAVYFFVAENIRSNHRSLSICVALGAIVACPWAVGVSIIGGHGLLINYFTQTETTWPFIFVALLCLQKCQFAKTGLALGAVFAINAFVGLWLIWAAAFTTFFAKIPVSRKQLIRGGLCFLLIAGPVMWWVVSTGNIAKDDVSFSYVEYARIYNPYHYLIEVSKTRTILQLLLLFSAGVLACRHVEGARFWVGVQVSLLILFVVGAFLPYLFDYKFVIILHFLRSDGVEQFLAVLLIGTAAANLWFSEDSRDETKTLAIFIFILLVAPYPTHSNLDIGCIVAALLLTFHSGSTERVSQAPSRRSVSALRACFSKWHLAFLYAFWIIASVASSGLTSVIAGKIVVLVLALALVKFRFIALDGNRVRVVVVSALVALCAWTALLASEGARQFSEDENSPQSKSFRQLTAWIRQSSYHGPFLVRADAWGDSFQLLARRTVWVDWKQGGAILWVPSFYPQWSARYAEVSQLHTPEAFLAYASKNGIQNVILDADGATCPSDALAEKRFGAFTFCHLRPTDGASAEQAEPGGVRSAK